MNELDAEELELLGAFDKGKLKSVATKSELAKFKAAARATAIKDKRVNIRLSSGDLSDLQVRALQEGVPYQTLIASIVHKYVTGRLSEKTEVAAAPRVARGTKQGLVIHEDAEPVVPPDVPRQASVRR